MGRLADQRILVTGASAGIGAALATELHGRGARVGLLARREAVLEELAAPFRARRPDSALVLPANVTHPEAVAGAVERLTREWGGIDVLVLNAGVGHLSPAAEYSASQVSREMQVNYHGAVNCLDAALPHMLAAGAGHIVGMASLAALRAVPAMAAYSASKAALATLLSGYRMELAPRGIQVTTLYPGFIRTDLLHQNRGQPHPFTLDLLPATRRMADAIEAGRAEVFFPWPMAVVCRLNRWVPNAIYDRLARWTMTPTQFR